jgi:TonB-dependent SusC/RagA subfamily outer membrane receptor
VRAQTGTIQGVILDPTGGTFVQGTAVRVAGTQLSAVTDSLGRFTIRFVVPGTYNVSVRQAGFVPMTLNDVSVASGTASTLKIGLTAVSGDPMEFNALEQLVRRETQLTQPMYVIDGIIMMTPLPPQFQISALNIKSIEVIKGAAAASLYGAKAGNGVIVIKTK